MLAATERQIALYSFPSLLRSCSWMTQALGRGRRHARQDHDLVDPGARADTTPGRDPSFLIGGVPLNFRQSWRLGNGPEFVVEGDEYDTAFFDKGSKFLHYRPRTAILTSVEFDHADIFARRRGGQGGVPQVRRADPRGRPAAGLRGVAGRDGRRARRALPGRRPTGVPGSGADWIFEVRGARVGRAHHAGHRAPGRARAGAGRDLPARHLQLREPGRRRSPSPRRWASICEAIARAARALPGRAAPARGARRRRRA